MLKKTISTRNNQVFLSFYLLAYLWKIKVVILAFESLKGGRSYDST